jgi:hypothetical protein
LTTFAGRVEANSASYVPPRKTEKHPWPEGSSQDWRRQRAEEPS